MLGFGACTGQPNSITLNQNLGADKAAFGLFSAGLQQALLSGNYDKLSVDFRMAADNNGYEQLIIESIQIPEPITVMLFGWGACAVDLFASSQDEGRIRTGNSFRVALLRARTTAKSSPSGPIRCLLL